MGNELNLTPEQIELVKRTIAKGATNDELAMFMAQAKRTGLDPFSRQIYLIERRSRDGDNWITTRQVQVSVDGLRLVAERSDKYAGQLGPMWCGKDAQWRDVPEVDGQIQTVVPLVKIEKPAQGAWEPNVVWFADRVERQWVEGTPAPLPTMTAEEAVSKFFSPYQTLALQRFEMALLQANKPLGPKMSACKTWLESVMLGWALSPVAAPSASFGSPAASFEEASAEAVTDLAG
jgi:hypothetical protein